MKYVLMVAAAMLMVGCGSNETTKTITVAADAPAITCEVVDLAAVAVSGTSSMSGIAAVGSVRVASLNSPQVGELDIMPTLAGTPYASITSKFGLRCSLMFKVTQGGAHSFRLRSDDGSVLYVNGILVVNHDGMHGYTQKAASATLMPGTYAIDILYVEGNGPKGLIASVIRAGSPFEELIAAN